MELMQDQIQPSSGCSLMARMGNRWSIVQPRGRLTILLRNENGESASMGWGHPEPEVVTTERVERCPAGYVFADGFQDDRRLGNKFYDLAAGYFVARMTGRCLAINGSSNVSDIENIFLFGDYIVHKEAPGPEYVDEFLEENDLVYDDRNRTTWIGFAQKGHSVERIFSKLQILQGRFTKHLQVPSRDQR